MRPDQRKTNPKYDPPARAMTIPTENLDAMIQFLTDASETSGDHFMKAADMLRIQQARIAEIEAKAGTVVADVGALVELLEQAAEDIQEWGVYASSYFQEKHNLSANVDKYREAARRLLAGGGQ